MPDIAQGARTRKSGGREILFLVPASLQLPKTTVFQWLEQSIQLLNSYIRYTKTTTPYPLFSRAREKLIHCTNPKTRSFLRVSEIEEFS
jgi:hypothetical protein